MGILPELRSAGGEGMSAKDTADAILRDFRTSMADTAVYTFDSEDSAREALNVMEQPDYLFAELNNDMIAFTMVDPDERMLSI